MSVGNKSRSVILDGLKGIAIIAVFLYHFGSDVLPYGYLGVDVFFVVGGYFLVNQLVNCFERNTFNYFSFILKKIIRLFPLIVLLIMVSMILGYFLMLPNDYENLAESAVASAVFCNNILQCITTKNYWDVVNLFKPLMHLWYIGVLMQAYVILPLLYLLALRICKTIRKGIVIATAFIMVGSLILFIIPWFSSAWKFYFLPFRLFEIVAGGLVVQKNNMIKPVAKKIISFLCFIVLLCMICARREIISGSVMLVIVVLTTMLFITFSQNVKYCKGIEFVIKIVSEIGKRSYSIYIWHQMIIAFLFYAFFPKHNIWSLLVCVSLTTFFSFVSYQIVEVRTGQMIKKGRNKKMLVISTVLCAVIISVFSFMIYLNAGVVRDVPELEIKKNEAHKGMHSEYCDRVYSWNHPFNQNNTKKILVIGNSFGRDWGNVLYEYNSDLDISFLYYSEGALIENIERVEDADIVFYALGLSYGSVPDVVVENVPREKLYVVSNKNYGVSNGIVYAQRSSANYYSQTVEYSEELEADINSNQMIWGDHYINMMNPVLDENNRIRVFTDDNMLISQDCRHLTRAGAKYYSRKLGLERFFINE